VCLLEENVNQLELRLRHQSWTADATVGTNVDVLVDGELLADFGDYATDVPFGLLPSIEYDGRFDILTCTCGNAGCSGLGQSIQVTHEGGLVHWRLIEPLPPRHLTFDEREYAQEVHRLVDEGKKLASNGTLTDTVPDVNQRLFDGDDQTKESMEQWRRIQLERGEWRAPPTG
jgi:hypothetical protein